ncbi:MarR family winged helix-turn-helix transcriptional regulator [Paraburkholderia sp. SIMBA_054]
MLTRTREISRVVTTIYDDALRPFGINAPQFPLLVLITELGPLSRSNLWRRNHQDRSTLTRSLQPLIAQGWISEGLPANDGRDRLLLLTGRGKALLRTAAFAWSSAQRRARGVSGEVGVSALMDIASGLPERVN